ncbi:hypothetical protein ACFQVB_43755 [Paraburkholderia humisilvae]|uniref:hypothetical protein n=1 Tax=Paraburkholderia humisilvae TaxID=627669 RepID=UPI00360F74E5
MALQAEELINLQHTTGLAARVVDANCRSEGDLISVMVQSGILNNYVAWKSLISCAAFL